MLKFLSKFRAKTKKPTKRANQDYNEQFKMTLREWLLYHQKEIVFNDAYWMGTRSLKSPLDAWIYQEIIHEIKPDIIIEIGSYEGGSTLYLANLLDLLGKGTVVSIDIDRSKYSVRHDRIIAITGNSSSLETFKKVSELCHNRSVLIIHDGDHSKEGVLKDLNLYSPLVSTGSYFIVEDGIVDLFEPGDGMGLKEDGPLRAVEEFLSKNSNFVADSSRERYIATYNPKGFLKRIR